MNSFLVKISSEEELINGLKRLNDIGALGTEIIYGTYLGDSYVVSDIINRKFTIWSDPKEEDDICALSINYDDEYRNKEYPNLYGKNHIMVSLSTIYDIDCGDVPEEKVSYNKMIDETLKLLNK